MGKVTTGPLIIISMKVGIRSGFSVMFKCVEEKKTDLKGNIDVSILQ